MPPHAAATTMPPYLQEATKNSTVAWQQHLASLFRHCKERFPDVVWELTGEEDETNVEEVYGHKAIVYARAPPSFQSRYFSFKPNHASSPLPYSTSPTPSYPAASALSLGLEYPPDSRASSPYRSTSPSPSTNPSGPLLRIRTSHNPTLFSNELEYLYTGQGFGEAFEFLFDSAESREEGDAEELRIDKLRKDLVYMWRSRLYSDVRLALTGNFSSTNHETTTAVFATHRFILVSRCPYFHTALLAWPSKPVTQTPGEPLTLNLPSPPFTPASLHFTLGFIYTGTLVFSHRSYDLDTAFQIMRSATYLGLQTLYDEIQARLVQEMMHGLFHAFLEFSEYESLTGGKWGTGGCRCRQCARRAPRILEFAMSDDVKNAHLDRGARRALVGLFGEGWCTTDFAELPQKTRESLLKGVGKRTTPTNVFALLFAAEHATNKLSAVIDTWADTVREMILAERKVIDDVICSQSKEVFEQPDWLDLMRSGGDGFEDKDRVKLIMDAAIRGLSDKNAPTLYQTLVGTILLRPHPTEAEQAMLTSTSVIRELVEQARVDVLRWIGKRWLGIRHEGGFAGLEGWALHEISDSIDVPIEDLETPQPRGSHSRSAHKSLLIAKPDGESDTMSMHSMRVSLLSRNLPKRGVTPTQREVVTSSGASVRSVRSTVSTASRATNNTLGASPNHHHHHQRHRKKDSGGSSSGGGGPDLGPRPDSKLTPEPEALRARTPSPTQPSIIEPLDERDEDADHRTGLEEQEEFEGNTTPSTPLPKTLVKKIGVSSPTSPMGVSPSGKRTPSGSRTGGTTPIGGGISLRPKASVSSISPSLRSHASTVRKSSAGLSSQANTNSTYASLRPPSSHSNRPISSVSTNTESGASFRTASSRARRSSAASTQSALSVKTPGQNHSPHKSGGPLGVSPSTSPVRMRRLSNSSTTSTTTNNTTTTTNRSVSTTTTTHSTSGSKRTPVKPKAAGTRGRETDRLSPGTSTGAGAVKRPVSVASNKSSSTNTSGGTAGSKKVLVTIRRPPSNVSLRSEAAAANAAAVASPSSDSLAPPLPPLPPQIEKSVSSGSSVSSSSRSTGSRESRTSRALSAVPSTVTGSEFTGLTRPESRASTTSRTMTTAREDGSNLGDQDEDGDDRMGQSLPPPPTQEEEGELTNTASTLTVRPLKINRDSVFSTSDYASASSGPSPRSATKELDHKKTDSNTSVASVATLKRKGSNDTITTLNPKGSSSRGGSKPSSQVSSVPPSKRPEDLHSSVLQTPQMPILSEQLQDVFQPRGATLDIGIPCIISSKRKRFKAFARYIGEVEGETGPWVGVEVPFPESWTGDRDKLFEGEGRQWHDGTWGGVRYFEIGGVGGSEWDMDDDRMSRRRKMERDHWTSGKGHLKREGDQLSIQRERAKRMRSVSPAVSDLSMSESRGLFVRPQQVLYVVDAVGSDL